MNCLEITFFNFSNNLSHALYVIKINRRTLHEKEKSCRTFTIGKLFGIQVGITNRSHQQSSMAEKTLGWRVQLERLGS